MGWHAGDAEERKRAFEDARRCEEETGKPPWKPSIRVTLLCLVLTPIFAFFIPTTVKTAVGSDAGSVVEPTRHGTGEVRGCSRVGPVSTSGFGLWWTCEVSVNWDDGGRGDYPAEDSQFSPSDVGHSFRVELGGLGWDSGDGYIDKIPDRYVVLRSGLERPDWPYVVTLFAIVPFLGVFLITAYAGVAMRWTEFCNFLRARLPRR